MTHLQFSVHKTTQQEPLPLQPLNQTPHPKHLPPHPSTKHLPPHPSTKMPPAPSPSTDQTSPPPSISHQNQTSIAAWNANALFWDAYMGDAGNEFYQLLELPALQRLVDPQPNEHILDLATGNGLVARWLANHGAIVTATDAAEAMLETARKRTTTPDEANRITYEVLDVTNETELAEMIARAEKVLLSPPLPLGSVK